MEASEDGCPFCSIASAYAPFSPTSKSLAKAPARGPSEELAYVVLSTPDVLCFLDHMPISRGHLLLIPRNHRPKISDVTVSESAVLGAWLKILSRATMRAIGALYEVEPLQDWNIVQNNGARAAQVVFHSHYHIIPRPASLQEIGARSWTMFGRGQRTDLDEEEAEMTRYKIRLEISKELKSLTSTDRQLLKLEEQSKL